MTPLSPPERARLVHDAVTSARITAREASAYLATYGILYEQAPQHESPAPSTLEPQVVLESPPPPVARSTASPPPRASFAGRKFALLLLVPIVLLGLVFLLGNGGPTGFVILDHPTSGTVLNDVTSVRATGELIGDGSAQLFLDTPNGTLMIASISSDDGSPITTKPSWQAGENVTINRLPTDYTAYLDDGTTMTPVTIPFPASNDATLLIVANTTQGPTTYRVPIIIGDDPRRTPFTSECADTCAITPTNGTLRIETTGNVDLRLSSLDTTETTTNHPPRLAVGFLPLRINTTTAIDLAGHFVDEDELLFTATTTANATLTMNGTILTIEPSADGDGTITVYVSDLHDLIPTTIPITITLPTTATNDSPSNTTPPGTNDTEQTVPLDPPTVTNATASETVNQTPDQPDTSNATTTPPEAPTVLDCSHPNPNLRPLSCLQAQPTEYFPEEDIYWRNTDRVAVARLNEVGNLLITGNIIQGSTTTPGRRDFVIGTPDRDGNIIPTAWISTTTGDLHVRRHLVEEAATMMPPPGTYSVITRRSIYLTYADYTTGDLYLRGNVIPYRTVIE